MNHCPVYGAVGGHAYGFVYPGPIGAVINPAIIGLKEAHHLPNASTFCGKCESVCPVKIPLPKLMRDWRTLDFEGGGGGFAARTGLRIWGFLAKRPRLYHAAARLGMALLGAAGRRRGAFSWLPLASGWTGHRDMPAPQGRTFQQLWAETKAGVPR